MYFIPIPCLYVFSLDFNFFIYPPLSIYFKVVIYLPFFVYFKLVIYSPFQVYYGFLGMYPPFNVYLRFELFITVYWRCTHHSILLQFAGGCTHHSMFIYVLRFFLWMSTIVCVHFLTYKVPPNLCPVCDINSYVRLELFKMDKYAHCLNKTFLF